jgi:hypothetical protein
MWCYDLIGKSKPKPMFRKANPLARIVVLAAATLALACSTRALTINVTYDPSVTSLANAAQVEAAFGAAVQAIQNLYTNSSSVNVIVYWGNAWPHGSIDLGGSYTQAYGTYTYAQLTNALRATRTTGADSNSVASLPAVDPAINAGAEWYIPRAEIKALGLASTIGSTANDTDNDGEIGFASNFTYTFDPNNRAVPAAFDFISVAEHELTEVMGRMTFGLTLSSPITFVPYDLFRFTSSGVRSFDPTAGNVYFSVDNGLTVLKDFYPDINTGDIQDWKTSSPHDSFDAILPSGVVGTLSAADLTSVDVIGYKLNYKPPRLKGATLGNGSFQLNFTNTPGTTYTILTSTNVSLSVSDWTNLGTTTETSAGQFQFTDTQAAGKPERFYRVRLN